MTEQPKTSTRDIDDPDLLRTQAREGVEKSATELRKQKIAIEMEPPTVFRP